MDDALQAYGFGYADGVAGQRDAAFADDPDYVVGLVDGQLVAFEEALVTAVRKVLGSPGKPGSLGSSGSLGSPGEGG